MEYRMSIVDNLRGSWLTKNSTLIIGGMGGGGVIHGQTVIQWTIINKLKKSEVLYDYGSKLAN